MSNKRAPKPTNNPQLRIIGGQWRGRKLQFAPIEGLRPTGDRLRETLFNWLQFCLPGASCLDLFAGSGALGLEALSRGAAAVDFIELDRRAARILQQQLHTLGAEGGRVYCTSAVDFLQLQPARPYDLVFVDPPFSADLWAQTLTLLASMTLAPEALVYVETPRALPLNIPTGWQLHREKFAGQVCMHLLRCPGIAGDGA
ncbi:MAG: 16S rRNA (guanine(966)-N(2))-methyltransferase RsmD [Gammaproteobacteria bacterium]|nr:16S rRNA (guanine(966)-N(2))-methyltransferase RsmD [Gammaproteobacteria bacterium]